MVCANGSPNSSIMSNMPAGLVACGLCLLLPLVPGLVS